MDATEQQTLIARKLQGLSSGKKYRKILLINPPQFPSGSVDPRIAKNKRYFAQPPYGIGLLARQLKDQGYETQLLDLNFEVLHHLVQSSDSCQIHDSQSLWESALQENIASYGPDLICVTCMFTTVYENARLLIKACKELSERTPMFVGGVAIINDPYGILKDNPGIDMLCLYECDETFCNTLDVLNGAGSPSQLSQIATMIDGNYIAIDERIAPVSPRIDASPYYGDLPLERYSSVGEIGAYRFWLPPGTRASTIISNRGCRAHCAFCSVHGFCGPGVRARNITAVVDEIEELQQHYGITHIMWLDDDLLFNAKRAVSLFNEIVRRGIKISWDATNGVIAAAVTDEIMDAAVASGCIGLNLGIETGSEKILKEMRKPATIHHYQLAASILKKYPQVFTRGFLIVGFPGETLADVQQTIEFARELALDWYTIQILCPLPASSLYQQIAGPVRENESLDIGNLSFGSSHTGRQRKIEQQEKLHALEFNDIFLGDLHQELDSSIINDIWFLADYRINYERIRKEMNPQLLTRWKSLLLDVADRITTDNPLANMFLAIIEERLGNHFEANVRRENVQKYTADSAYWAKRFEVLSLSNSR